MGLKAHHSVLQKMGDEADATNLCSGVCSPLGNHVSQLLLHCGPSAQSPLHSPGGLHPISGFILFCHPHPPTPIGCSHHCDAREEAAALPVASLRDLWAQVRAGGPLVPTVSDSMGWQAGWQACALPGLPVSLGKGNLPGAGGALKASTLSLDPALCCFPKPGIHCAHSGCRQGERPPAGGLDGAQRRGLVQGQPFHHLLRTPPPPTGWKRNRISTSSVSGATPRPSATQAWRTTWKDCGWAAPWAPACRFLPPRCLEVPPAAASTGRGYGKGP